MADGLKWIIATPNHKFLLNLGWFNDALSEDEKFATYDNQFVARLAYLPVVTEKGPLVHVAVMGRDVEPDENKFQAKSKPEAYLAPNYLDTGKFDSDHARTLGFEAYYRNGPWLVGGEYGWQWMDAPTVGDPMFHGGNISVAWLVTGETRGYNLASGYFKAVSPTRTVFEGGPGAVELALNLLLRRLGRRQPHRREILAHHTAGKVALDGLSSHRDGLRLRRARSRSASRARPTSSSVD